MGKKSIDPEAIKEADTIIASLLQETGIDYSSEKDEIARLFTEVLWQGNWDATTKFTSHRNLRFIQEDEYDQSMSEDEKPDWNDMVVYVSGHYVWYAD